ncbi:MAG TPA: response regulator [Ktedonobacterales bacterium]|nr:response regulator [Ktedonobacterales bacterium]
MLIVDPDWAAAESLAAALRPTCIVGIAATASDAISLLRQRTPDMILTELNLPDRSGIEFIKDIYSTPETHNVLLIVVTKRASVHDKIAAFQAGADDYLVKPVPGQKLQIQVQLVGRFRKVIRNEQDS